MRQRSMRIAIVATGLCLLGAAAHAQAYDVAYSFPGGKIGQNPEGGLTEFQERLLGTTQEGGSRTCVGGCGAVFSLSLTTGKANLVYAFQDSAGKSDSPRGNLVTVGGNLYGTALSGGPTNLGTVYSIEPHTHTETIVHAFQGGTDGANPIANLLDVAGTFYGVTADGGSGKAGTVFSIDVASGVEKVIYAFANQHDGSDPFGSLLEVDGVLYGVTLYGGQHREGTVYSVDPATGVETVLHSFAATKGGVSPGGSLIKVGNTLYGTARAGGDFDQGTVFSLSLSTGEVRAVYSFKGGTDGAAPFYGLVDVHGILYGTTTAGGDASCNCGTVFSLDLQGKSETVVHVFQLGGDGNTPLTTLTEVRGAFYGTTVEGGSYSKGTVFRVTPQ